MNKQSDNTKMQVIFCTFLEETSPQAMPLGIACIASALRKAKIQGTRIDTCYVSLEDNSSKTSCADLLLEKITSLLQDGTEKTVIGFSVYIWNKNETFYVAEKLKQMQNVTVIAGGPEVTANSNSFPENLFDYLIIGEGESSSVNLIRDISRNKNQKRIITSEVENCEALPSPWIDGSIDSKDFDGVLWELSRGCPFKCSYCYESKGIKKVRRFSEERIFKELDLFAKNDVPQIFVLDPTFNADKDRALRILREIKKRNPYSHYQFEIRSEFIDAKLARAFSEISCSLQIGLQSANPDVLKNINRTFDRKDFTRKIAILNDNGVVFGFDLIYGLPQDTYPSFKNSIDFAISLYPNHLEVFKLSVLPGTLLYEQADSFGLKYETKVPYHVLYSPTFSKADLFKAEKLATACNVFYSQGRAVPWFISVIRPLKLKPSQFLVDFSEWLYCNNYTKNNSVDLCSLPHSEIEKMQIRFLQLKYEEKNISYAFQVVKDIVCINGAMARASGEGEETVLSLSYHPEDLLSPESCDVLRFADEICMEHTKIKVFLTEEGPDFDIIG